MKAWLILAATTLVASQAYAHEMSGAPEWAPFGEPGHASAVTRTIAITAQDMRFSTKTLQVKLGETIRFVVINKGPSKHEFVIGNRAFHTQHVKEMAAMPDMPMDEPNSADVAPGKVKSVIWHFTKPGTYMFACDMPGHLEAGMSGTITVR